LNVNVTFIHIIRSTILSSFIHTASYIASIICNYKTNNDNSFYRGSAYDISGRESNRLDEALSAVEMMAGLAVMAAQAALAVMAALA
jgi:hypothetical protein